MNNIFRFLKKHCSIILLLLISLFPAFGFGQESDIDMADIMRENGKIYVVVAVVSVILAGLLVFLMIIDKRLRKLEKGK